MSASGLNSFQEIASGTIYLMGGCFILGSLFTLLLLLLLDFMQRNREKRNPRP